MASLGEASLLGSASLLTEFLVLQEKSLSFPCLPIWCYQILPVCLVYPYRCSRVSELIPEVGILVLVREF